MSSSVSKLVSVVVVVVAVVASSVEVVVRTSKRENLCDPGKSYEIYMIIFLIIV